MQTAGDYAVSAFFFFGYAIWRIASSEASCSQVTYALYVRLVCQTLLPCSSSKYHSQKSVPFARYCVRPLLLEITYENTLGCGKEKSKCNFPFPQVFSPLPFPLKREPTATAWRGTTLGRDITNAISLIVPLRFVRRLRNNMAQSLVLHTQGLPHVKNKRTCVCVRKMKAQFLACGKKEHKDQKANDCNLL